MQDFFSFKLRLYKSFLILSTLYLSGRRGKLVYLESSGRIRIYYYWHERSSYLVSLMSSGWLSLRPFRCRLSKHNVESVKSANPTHSQKLWEHESTPLSPAVHPPRLSLPLLLATVLTCGHLRHSRGSELIILGQCLPRGVISSPGPPMRILFFFLVLWAPLLSRSVLYSQSWEEVSFYVFLKHTECIFMAGTESSISVTTEHTPPGSKRDTPLDGTFVPFLGCLSFPGSISLEGGEWMLLGWVDECISRPYPR